MTRTSQAIRFRLGARQRPLLLRLARFNLVDHTSPSGLALIRAADDVAHLGSGYRALAGLVEQGLAEVTGRLSTGGGDRYRITEAGLVRLQRWAKQADVEQDYRFLWEVFDSTQAAEVEGRLAADLTRALIAYAGGATAWEVATGDDSRPGVMLNDDAEWQAWDWHPLVGTRVVVTHSDLMKRVAAPA